MFAPTLPDGFDPVRLDSMLVGVQDGAGRCLGLGVLGSIRLDRETMAVPPVRLRQLVFGI